MGNGGGGIVAGDTGACCHEPAPSVSSQSQEGPGIEERSRLGGEPRAGRHVRARLSYTCSPQLEHIGLGRHCGVAEQRGLEPADLGSANV